VFIPHHYSTFICQNSVVPYGWAVDKDNRQNAFNVPPLHSVDMKVFHAVAQGCA
jgi:hypothetical protein